MPEMTSPQGEVLTVPPRGVQPMRALGWEVTEPEPEPERQQAEPELERPAESSGRSRKQTRRKKTGDG